MVNSPPFRVGQLLVSVALPLGVWLGTVGLMSWQPSHRGVDLASGSAKFRDHCGACHILERGISTHHGPNLYAIGRTAATRKPGMTAAEYILDSILSPDTFVAPGNRMGMPRNLATNLAPEEIRDIVAFLASRQARPDLNEISQLEIPDLRPDPREKTTIRREEMELAERALREKGSCLQCHSLHRNAEYQVFAPALFGVGLNDQQLLEESIAQPEKIMAPKYRTVKVVMANGKVVTGRLVSRDQHQLTLIARDSRNELQHLEIPLSDVEVEDGEPLILESQQSLMPTGLDQLLTAEELRAITMLIQQLN